jgi:hypothetical protein
MPVPPDIAASVENVLSRITEAWRSRQPQLMAPLVDDNITMVLPDFSGRVTGRDAFIESFVTFDREASVIDYSERELQIDGTTDVAIAQSRFEMVYERDGERWRSTGWDVWVFHGIGWKRVASEVKRVITNPEQSVVRERPTIISPIPNL